MVFLNRKISFQFSRYNPLITIFLKRPILIQRQHAEISPWSHIFAAEMVYANSCSRVGTMTGDRSTRCSPASKSRGATRGGFRLLANWIAKLVLPRNVFSTMEDGFVLKKTLLSSNYGMMLRLPTYTGLTPSHFLHGSGFNVWGQQNMHLNHSGDDELFWQQMLKSCIINHSMAHSVQTK